MKEKLEFIAQNVKEKLSESSKYTIEEINFCFKKYSEEQFTLFLLSIACEFNLMQELDDLLQLNLLNDVDQPLELSFLPPTFITNHGDTLLGIASYHGHKDFKCLNFISEHL